MKRLVPLLAALLAALLLGCAAAEGSAGTVNTDGSSSMADVMAILQEVFRQQEPTVTVNYSGTGSGAGIEAVLSGTCDIGLSSRPLKPEEAAQGAVAWVVALDAVAVVVHPDNAVVSLSAEDLARLFTGEIVNWRELGGADAPVALYGRGAGSGTRSAFEDGLGITDRCRYTNVYGSTGDVVGNVASNPNAVGYVSLSAAGGGVRVLSVNGVPCTEETVLDGSYSLQRPFLFVTRADRPLTWAAQAFLDFAQSGDAAPYIARAGAIAPKRAENGA